MEKIVTILCLADSAHSLDTRDKHACLVSELNMSITQHSIPLTLGGKYIKNYVDHNCDDNNSNGRNNVV